MSVTNVYQKRQGSHCKWYMNVGQRQSVHSWALSLKSAQTDLLYVAMYYQIAIEIEPAVEIEPFATAAEIQHTSER